MENQNGSLTHCLHRVAADPRSDIRLPMLRHRNALGEISYLPPHCPDCGGKLVARPMVEGPSHLYECAGAGFHFADHRVAAFSNRTSVAHVGCGSRFMRRPDSRSGLWAGEPPSLAWIGRTLPCLRPYVQLFPGRNTSGSTRQPSGPKSPFDGAQCGEQSPNWPVAALMTPEQFDRHLMPDGAPRQHRQSSSRGGSDSSAKGKYQTMDNTVSVLMPFSTV